MVQVGLQRRNEECYAPVVQLLKYLVNNNLQEGTGAMLNQQGGLPAAAAEEAKAGILRVRPSALECRALPESFVKTPPDRGLCNITNVI